MKKKITESDKALMDMYIYAAKSLPLQYIILQVFIYIALFVTAYIGWNIVIACICVLLLLGFDAVHIGYRANTDRNLTSKTLKQKYKNALEKEERKRIKERKEAKILTLKGAFSIENSHILSLDKPYLLYDTDQHENLSIPNFQAKVSENTINLSSKFVSENDGNKFSIDLAKIAKKNKKEFTLLVNKEERKFKNNFYLPLENIGDIQFQNFGHHYEKNIYLNFKDFKPIPEVKYPFRLYINNRKSKLYTSLYAQYCCKKKCLRIKIPKISKKMCYNKTVELEYVYDSSTKILLPQPEKITIS